MCGWMAVKTVGLSAWQTAVWCSATSDRLRWTCSRTQVLAMAVWDSVPATVLHREVHWNGVD